MILFIFIIFLVRYVNMCYAENYLVVKLYKDFEFNLPDLVLLGVGNVPC